VTFSRFSWQAALALGLCGLLRASAAAAAAEPPSQLDRVVASVVARETALVASLEKYHPLVETYLQTLEPDRQLGTIPTKDDYFLGRLDLSRGGAAGSSAEGPASGRKLVDLFKEFYAHNVKPDGFARMIVLDAASFNREHYDFEFVRREFLGEVRTLVFEVVPKESARAGSFIGRIWVEDRDYSVVRYNGTCTGTAKQSLHFDSWRIQMGPGVWFPAYVYTEESEFRPRDQLLLRKLKGMTRIWGYEPKRRGGEDEFTQLRVDGREAGDASEKPGDLSPVGSLRAWEREAEENVLRRLEKSSLLAPAGEVDRVLETVVTNLVVTNSLEIDPPPRCRVLLTSPLESFTIGHTIVLSRGLIDVLPDEASLAVVLAHELGHVLLGHQLDTKYAFSDQMLVGDRQAMESFFFRRDPGEEYEADAKALMFLESSPYKGKLGNAGLFLKALSVRAKALPALIRPHFGNRLAEKDKLYRMTKVMESAPELYMTALNQTAALPLGGRVKVDPWTGGIDLMKNHQVVLQSPREKMPFEVTPLMPYLVRLEDPAAPPADRPAPVNAEPEIRAADARTAAPSAPQVEEREP
jgi:hypothetical protein